MLRSIFNSSKSVKPSLRTSILKVNSIRLMSDVSMGEYENKIYKLLEKEFEPKNLEVRDVSGGCGSMFAILVESDKFKGVPMVKQHRLVNEALKDEIAKWHGLQLRTKST